MISAKGGSASGGLFVYVRTRPKIYKFCRRSFARKAEEFIKSGQVFINGRKAKLGDKVDAQKDTVKVYGKIIKPPGAKIYIMMNKPKSFVVSKKIREEGKPCLIYCPKNCGQKSGM